MFSTLIQWMASKAVLMTIGAMLALGGTHLAMYSKGYTVGLQEARYECVKSTAIQIQAQATRTQKEVRTDAKRKASIISSSDPELDAALAKWMRSDRADTATTPR